MSNEPSEKSAKELIEEVVALAKALADARAKDESVRADAALMVLCNKLSSSGETIDNVQAVKLLDALSGCSDDYERKQLAALLRKMGGVAALNRRASDAVQEAADSEKKQNLMGETLASCVLDMLAAAPDKSARERLATVLKSELSTEAQMEHIVKAMLTIPDKSLRMKVMGALHNEFGPALFSYLTALFERPLPAEQKLRTGESILFMLNGMYPKETDPDKKAAIGAQRSEMRAAVDEISADLRGRKPPKTLLAARIEKASKLTLKEATVVGSEEVVPPTIETKDIKSFPKPNKGTNQFEESRRAGKVPGPENDPFWKRLLFRKRKQKS